MCMNSVPFVQSAWVHFDIFENMLCSRLMNSDEMINVNLIFFSFFHPFAAVPFWYSRKESFLIHQTHSDTKREFSLDEKMAKYIWQNQLKQDNLIYIRIA